MLPHRQCLFAVSSEGRRSKVAVFRHFYKVTNPFIRASWPNYFPRCHLQISWHWGLGFNIGNLGGHKHSVYGIACIHCYNVIQNDTALKFSVLYVLNSSFTSAPAIHWSFYSIHSFAFSRMLYRWNQTIYNLLRLTILT